MNILALEASTSAAKAILYNKGEGIIATAGKSYPEKISNVVTQDPDEVYKILMECGRELLQSVDCKIDGIGLGSTWHSLLYLDKNRQPVGRTITWANTMAGDTVERYRQDETLGNWLYQRTGCPIHSMYPLWKWIHMKEKGMVELGRKYYLSSQPEYIYEKMTGEVGVSKSVASGTGFMNIHTLDWDDEVLDMAGLERGQLASLYEPDHWAPLGEEAARELGLEAGIPVVIAGPDGALNQIGSGALGKGIMTLSVGTSGALRIACEQPLLPENPSTWCYYAASGKRLAGAATSGAGNCVQWFARRLNQGSMSYKQLDSMIDEVVLEDAPIFLPFLYGERCPGWEDSRLGGFQDLRGTHEVKDFYYAVLEGILFNLFQCYEILVGLGETPSEIRISGGIENSPQWLQMAADIFQRDIYTSRIEHASVMGAVALTLKAVGGLKDLNDFEVPSGDRIVPDQSKADIYRKRFVRYKEWYERTSKRRLGK